MDRRTFLLGAAAFAAGCSRPQDDVVSVDQTTTTGTTGALGVQLYTVRDRMAQDVAATLDLVAWTGFEEVEFAGYYEYSPAEMRAMLNAAGLAAPAAHISKARFSEDMDRVIEHAAEMGHAYAVVPSIAEDERSLDDYRRHADDFNRFGEACAAAGIQFAYHNHVFEFVETDGQVPYDLLLAETDPELVKMELDLAWATAGNVDVLAYFSAWPGRFPLFHLKDVRDGAVTNIGTGIVDFETILAHAGLAGLQHGFVEHDRPVDSAAAIRANHDAIRPLWSKYTGRAAAG